MHPFDRPEAPTPPSGGALVDNTAERNAFARACGYLNYSRWATWTAHLAGFGTGLVYVGLLVLLWLFVDLMVSRGRLPAYSQLTHDEKVKFVNEWNGLSPAERRAAVKERTGVELDEKEDPKADGENLSAEVNRTLWVANLRRLLVRVYRLDDGSHVQPVLDNPDWPQTNVGAWSLIVRQHAGDNVLTRPWTQAEAAVVRWNPWMRNVYYRPPNTYLVGLFVLPLLLTLAAAGLNLRMREMAARAAIEASTRLRRGVYQHTFRLGTLAFRTLGPSEAVSIFTRHIEAVHEALYARLTTEFREPVKFALILFFALVLNPLLALAFLLFAVLVWLVGGQIALGFARRARAASNEAGENLAALRESLMMMRLVKCYFRMEQFNSARVERQLTRYAHLQRVRHRGEALARPVLFVLAVVCALVLLFVAGVIVLSGRMDAAAMVAMATALVSLYRPVEQWWEARKTLRRGHESAAQVFRFLDRRSEVGQVVGAEFLHPLSRKLEFDNVSLREPGGSRMLLDGVTLTVQAGQRVGLIGADDLEKHALVYLIPRLLDPTAGEIRIDQHNLRWVTLDSLRNQIAPVLQHNLVFHDTVANNIGCGDSAYTLPQIIEAAKVAHAHQFIQKLPQGYETPIGELGHPLTAAQQFLIALARAILRDPALLIIEEPETPLDDDTKSLLDDTLTRVLPGRTAIFLPHRISTTRGCDTLYVLYRGRVVASGTHKELLATNALYRHLHYLEFNEVEEQVATETPREAVTRAGGR
jgi:ATP-binding cassette, subfamily B, bacterial